MKSPSSCKCEIPSRIQGKFWRRYHSNTKKVEGALSGVSTRSVTSVPLVEAEGTTAYYTGAGSLFILAPIINLIWVRFYQTMRPFPNITCHIRATIGRVPTREKKPTGVVSSPSVLHLFLSNSSPQGYSRLSVPRAAFSHSASPGKVTRHFSFRSNDASGSGVSGAFLNSSVNQSQYLMASCQVM